MQFATPPWLLCLIPWAALAIYLLRGRRRRVIVPFIDLWPTTAALPRSRWKWNLPPPLAAALAALFLGILAAAGPRTRGAATDRPVILIVDRGITMSARSGALRRFQKLAYRAAGQLLDTLGPGPANLIVIPTGTEQPVDRANWTGQVAALAPTAVDTRAELADAVRLALRQDQAIVVLFSDLSISVSDDRLVQIAPEDSPSNIGIERLAVRTAPAPQAMVRIVSSEAAMNATLRVTGAAPLHIGAAGDYFVDLPSAPDVVEASVDPDGDIDADDHAWVVRTNSWPKLQSPASLPPELARLTEAYARNRPPDADSPSVAILPLGLTDAPAAMVVTEATPTIPASAAPVEAAADPLTQGVDWQAALRDAQVAQSQPGTDFTRLVWSGDQTLVAVRSSPNRQVWVGFRSATWAETPEFVVFWSKAFDWLGAASPRYSSSVAGESGLPLWPGLYRDKAVNAAALPHEFAAPQDWRKRLAALAESKTGAAFDYSSWILVLAIGCLLLAAVV